MLLRIKAFSKVLKDIWPVKNVNHDHQLEIALQAENSAFEYLQLQKNLKGSCLTNLSFEQLNGFIINMIQYDNESYSDEIQIMHS
jgi:hypothetical protein